MASILVVDDHRDTRDVLALLIERDGFAVTTARNGAEALELAALEQPAVVLLDLHLPDIDGFEVCRRLRSTASTRDIKVCAMTAVYTGSDNTYEAMRAGADGLLRKPVDPRELRATLDALLKAPRGNHRRTA